MTVDNFNLFKKIINVSNPDEFYFVQILIRGKDGHTERGVNGNNKNRLIKFYTIKSVDHLCRVEDEIKSICKAVNGRAYIHPTKRSFTEVAKECMRISMETFLSDNNIGLKGSYSTACGKSFIKKNKQYVIDLDGEEATEERIKEILDFTTNECNLKEKNKFLYKVPTPHGIHLIMIPFDTDKFKEKYPNIDVHKNNPTLLYYSEPE